MHTNQPAVFVVVADVMEFFDKFTQTVKFLVCYEVKSELMTARLTLNAGEVNFDFRTICGQESDVKLTTAEGMGNFSININGVWMKNVFLIPVYKDLLAITSTCSMVRLELKFEKPPKLKFQEFLESSMSFVQLTSEWKPENPENVSARKSNFPFILNTDFSDSLPWIRADCATPREWRLIALTSTLQGRPSSMPAAAISGRCW